ncbi:MAG: putative N6-adenine-specific DNA methylase [Pseudohongiellaceae bacterium]|jgi:putative N6-adenine-specific DNA methylase
MGLSGDRSPPQTFDLASRKASRHPAPVNPQQREYYMPCTLGLEEALAAELTALGAANLIVGRGGVSCSGTAELGASACLWLRSGIRVQELLTEFKVREQDDLYDGALAVPWERYVGRNDTVAVDASVRDAVIKHSGYAALRVKDAVVDRLRDQTGQRPDVDRKRPDVPLKLALKKGTARLYRDWAGASLHKRGYRPIQVKSPLNEATAAGLLLLAGWTGQGDIVDPLCGSATLLIEAAWIAADRAPGLRRHFAGESWPDSDAELWKRLRADAEARRAVSLPIQIAGVDRHSGAVALARQALIDAEVSEMVSVQHAEAGDWTLPTPPAWVVTNPPYGERLGEGDDLLDSWDQLSRFLKNQCHGSTAHVLSGDSALTGKLRLKADRRWAVHNGPIDCRWLRYSLHDRRPKD